MNLNCILSFVFFNIEGGRLCTFSPCIEQVQRTCQQLRTNGFEEINTIECLRRIHEFRYQHRNKICFTADKNQEDTIEAKSIKRESINDQEDITTEKKFKSDLEIKPKKQPQESETILTAIGPLVMPGHTGYLTFAYLKQE